MKQLEIIIGSQMGGTEYVAEHLSQLLADQGIETQLHEQPDLQHIDRDQPWLICTSTHGAGDYPDNLLTFIEQLDANEQLNQVHFAVIGVGDSSYDTFNFAAKNIVSLLQTKGATLLLPQLEIDVLGEELPEDTAEQWLPNLLQAWKRA